MGNHTWSDKKRFIWVLTLLLVTAFLATSGISYKVARDSLIEQVEQNTLPLTSDNIYSEIQQDLLNPIFISSLMAQDTFVREWTLNQEQEPGRLIRYLKEIQERYGTVTSFFVSEQSRNYYHASGILKQIKDTDPADSWYFRVRSLPEKEQYEINIDADTADRSKTTVFVNYKVNDFEGNFIGITGVGLAVEKVKNLIELYQKRYNRVVYFADREGVITLSGSGYYGGNSLQHTPGIDKLATRILTAPSGSFTYVRDGKNVYVNSRLVPEFKWYLLVEQEEAKAEKTLLGTFWINMGMSLLVVCGVLFIANMTLGRYQRKLEHMASIDKLTGAANRQVFEEIFENSLLQAKTHSTPLSVILMDIDHFKQVNDTHGHSMGDLVLRTVANLLCRDLSPGDLLCRWGGEEFLLMAPLDMIQARERAEQLRLRVAEHQLKVNGHDIRVNISVGVAQFQYHESADQLIKRADTALYQAKDGGRDQVVLSHP